MFVIFVVSFVTTSCSLLLSVLTSSCWFDDESGSGLNKSFFQSSCVRRSKCISELVMLIHNWSGAVERNSKQLANLIQRHYPNNSIPYKTGFTKYSFKQIRLTFNSDQNSVRSNITVKVCVIILQLLPRNLTPDNEQTEWKNNFKLLLCQVNKWHNVCMGA